MWRVARRMQRPMWGPGLKYGRFGVTGGIAIIVVVLTLIAAWIIDQRSASAADQRVAELAREAEPDPIEVVTRAARANRLVFLSDIAGSVAIKRFAAEALMQIVNTSGLDAVVLEIGSDQQAYVSQYLERDREDASVLLAHPRTIRDNGTAARAYLDIYGTIWRLNQRLGPDQRIRVVAADLPGWPPEGALSPSAGARAMADREAHMEAELRNLLASIPRARVLVFAGGLHTLKAGTIALQTGGTTPVTFTPLAARFATTSEEVFTVVADAPAGLVPGAAIAPYAGTRVAAVLDRAGVRRRFGLRLTSDFDHMRQPILVRKTPGIQFDLLPRDYALRAVADAYINLGR